MTVHTAKMLHRHYCYRYLNTPTYAPCDPALAEKIRVVSSAAPERRRIAAGKEKESNELDNICQGVVELSSEKIHGNFVQVAKKILFCDCSTRFNNIFNIINK